MDANRLEELLDLLLERMSSGSLEWSAPTEDTFVLQLEAGTVSLSSSPTVFAFNTGTTLATTAGGYSTEPLFRLSVFNSNGVKVAELRSDIEQVQSKVANLFEVVKERTLGADDVIAGVLQELREETPKERRVRRSS